MSKLKLMTIVGTRPEIIKLSEIIKKSNNYFDHILVHTGQNYDYNLNEIFFIDLGIKQPQHYLEVVGENLGFTVGNIISKSYEILLKEKPDALLILGDTNSCLSALSAKRLKIPVFHMEAGNRCFDENLPEEINRRIVDHISDVNLCYSEHARRYLNSEGIAKDRTFVVGSPMSEVITANLEKINTSNILKHLNLERNKYIILSAHREENIDNEDNFISLMNSINRMAEAFKIPIIYSTHPRSKKLIEKRGFTFHEQVKNMDPFGFTDYCELQKNAICVVSDSGTLAEESSFFKFPAVSIRTSTERPEALDGGNIIVGGITVKDVLQAVRLAIEMYNNRDFGSDVINYTDTNVSTKVIKIIQSYTNIVNNTVWRKK